MEPQFYKVVNAHAHEISGWKILSSIIHVCAPHIGGMNCDVQSDLVTPEFKNGEQLEDFHSRIIRIEQEIKLYGETVSPKIILFQYTELFSKSDKIKDFIAPKMTYLTTLVENNGKLSIHTGGNIHGLYMIIWKLLEIQLT